MNILTIDLEDWFHILAHDKTASPQQWEKFESRVERNTEWILEQLKRNHQQATFFCLGWIGARYPELIRRIAGQGHEIACHSMNHQLVYEQSAGSFKQDLLDARHLLQDISGQAIKTYRAPGFSISEKSNWVFEILMECGFENDCSVFPAARNHGGYPDFPYGYPCKISMKNKVMKEFPLSLVKVAGFNIIYSGGGYFRLLPYSVIQSMMRKSTYTMTYFHPRDFDPGQPMLSSLPLKRKLMSYVGLRGAKHKFEKLLHDFRFVNVEEAARQVQWDKAPLVTLS